MRIHALICIISIGLLCIITTAINITPITWTTLPITMPFSRYGLITAFDIHTGLVWILGGWTEDDICQWNMTSNDFTYVGALSRSTYSWAQNGVTKDRVIYWVDYIYFTESIRSFDTISAMETANDLNASFPFRTRRSCVTTDGDKYLIIVGGYPSYMDYTQIYNFETMEWLSNMPQLNQGRGYHSCHVYNASYVYAIAGWTGSACLKIVEKLDLETMSNWIVSPHQLTHERVYHRSVLIDDFIIVTGGYDGSSLKSVEIISMVDDSITSATDLNIAVRFHGIIRGPMNNVIVLGGYTSSGQTNKIQVSNTFTSAPTTSAPTTSAPTTSAPTTPAPTTYLVVGAISICFFLLCVVCFWMRRKMRNKNVCADDDDPQNKVNNLETIKLVDVNNNVAVSAGLPSKNCPPPETSGINTADAVTMQPLQIPAASAPYDEAIAQENSDTDAKSSKKTEDITLEEVHKSEANLYREGIPAPSAPAECSISVDHDKHKNIPFIETRGFGENSIEMQPEANASYDINVDVLPPGYDPAAENNKNYMMNEETHQVREWMISLDISEYFEIFVENGFDKMERIKLMDSSDLTEMGITKIGHRKQILSAIKNM